MARLPSGCFGAILHLLEPTYTHITPQALGDGRFSFVSFLERADSGVGSLLPKAHRWAIRNHRKIAQSLI